MQVENWLQSLWRTWFKQGKWRFESQGLDYGLLLPLMGRLPLRLAYRLSDWRGAFNARRARDWAELSVGFPYIAPRAAAGYRELFPKTTEPEIQRLVVQRYQTIAREELEGMLAIQGRLNAIDMDLTPIHAILKQRQPERGLVVVMSHLDNLFLGLVGIARCGVPVYLMTSDVVQHPQVHPTLRRFFKRKYDAYQQHIGGGSFLPASRQARETFYSVLRAGGIVAVISETPAAKAEDKGTWVQWMGKRRKVADGAIRMALDTQSQIVAMANTQTRLGHMEWAWSDLLDTKDYANQAPTVARQALAAIIFKYLEASVRTVPGRWWAAHLLQDFEVQLAEAKPSTG